MKGVVVTVTEHMRGMNEKWKMNCARLLIAFGSAQRSGRPASMCFEKMHARLQQRGRSSEARLERRERMLFNIHIHIQSSQALHAQDLLQPHAGGKKVQCSSGRSASESSLTAAATAEC